MKTWAREVCQAGRVRLKVWWSLVQSRRLLAGRRAGVGNSAVGMGMGSAKGMAGWRMRAWRMISWAKPCQVVEPELVAW